MNHLSALLADASVQLVLRGLWNGFKAIPVAIWHLFPNNVKTLYNLSFIVGMLIFLLVVLIVLRGPRPRRTFVRRRVRV